MKIVNVKLVVNEGQEADAIASTLETIGMEITSCSNENRTIEGRLPVNKAQVLGTVDGVQTSTIIEDDTTAQPVVAAPNPATGTPTGVQVNADGSVITEGQTPA